MNGWGMVTSTDVGAPERVVIKMRRWIRLHNYLKGNNEAH